MKRRDFVKRTTVASMAGLPLTSQLYAAESRMSSVKSDGRPVDIETLGGRLRGRHEGGMAIFRGIPYAEPPVGALRFRAPQPVKPWAGTREAVEFGPAAIQTVSGYISWVYTQPEAMDEDCLTLNIWSSDTTAAKPVIVWIHGGGYRTGASSMPVFDGIKYAETGKVVMVSINYRLGILGWAAHEDLSDPNTGAFANWAIQDQILALRWIRDNISAFGGDPNRITVMGESGGAINAIMIAHEMDETLFHQIIAMSPPHICPPATLDMEGWRKVMEDLAREFGTTVSGLRSVPAMDLHNAELRQFGERRVTTDTGRAYRGTVVDGVVLKEWPAWYAMPKCPMILGYTRTEGASRYDFFDPVTNRLASPPAPDDAAIRQDIQQMLNALYNLDDGLPNVEDVIVHYAQSLGEGGLRADIVTIARELFGDMGGRHYAVRKAEHAAKGGHKDLFMYQYGLPLLAPNHEPAHATELAVVFGTFTHPHYRTKIGEGALQHAVSNAIIEAFATFAEAGRPESPLLPAWPAFGGDETVMIFGEDNRVGQTSAIPKHEQLSILDKLAGLKP